MKKIAITGSRGFIGSKFKKKFSKKYNLYKIGEQKNIHTLKYIKKFDILFHFAFVKKIKNQNDYIKNKLTMLKLLKYCVKYKATMIFISTYLYGDQPSLINENTKVSPASYYSLSKKNCEDMCKLFNTKYNLNVIILRTFNIYDDNLTQDTIFKKIIISYQQKRKLEIYKNFIRDYLHIEDFLECLSKLINKRIKGQHVFNLASGKSFSNIQILKLFEQEGIINNKILFKDNKFYPKKIKVNISNINKYLNWFPSKNFHKNIKEVAKKYL